MGQPVIEAGSQGLEVARDIPQAPQALSGVSAWVAPWDGLRTRNPKRVLALFNAKRSERLHLALLATAGERLKPKTPRTVKRGRRD